MKKLNLKNSCIVYLVAFIAGQLASILLASLGFIIGGMAKVDTNSVSAFFNSPLGYLIANIVFDATLVVCFVCFNSKENKIVNNTKVWKIFLYILVGIFAIFLLSPIVNVFNMLLVKCGVTLQKLPYELTTKNYLISIVSMAIIPAIAEELLFRGLIFKGLKKHGKALAIVITSIMFMLFHLAIDQAIYPLLMGLLLAVIMWKEDNILYCIAVHLTNNLMSLTISYFHIPITFNHLTFILIAIVLFIAYLCAIVFYIMKNKKGEKLEKSEKTYLVATMSIMTIIWIAIALIRIL